jgi:RNA polymerase II subunit A small phosphatase-like protein
MKNDRKLVIFDLNGTVLHATKNRLRHEPQFQVRQYHIYVRPKVVDTLENLASHYDIAFWSSASNWFVDGVVSQLLPAHIKPAFQWGSSQCTYVNKIRTPDRFEIYRKDLQNVVKLGYDWQNILMIDDTPIKILPNDKNVIQPKTYTGKTIDDEFYFLETYLLHLKTMEDVQAVDKTAWKASNKII